MSKLPFLTRAFFARATDPVARGALRIGLTPDVVTVIGTAASVAGALTLYPMGQLFYGATTGKVRDFIANYAPTLSTLDKEAYRAHGASS